MDQPDFDEKLRELYTSTDVGDLKKLLSCLEGVSQSAEVNLTRFVITAI